MNSKTNLTNWRTAPYSQWGFQNVRQLIPTANIQSAKSSQSFNTGDGSVLDSKQFACAGEQKLETILNDSHTDSLLVLHRGKRVWQWQAKHTHIAQPHIVFSVSKSITAMLAGILIEQKILDTTKPILYYLPEVKGSAYSDCSLQQLLDMQVALEFDESYLEPTGVFRRYRDSTGWNSVDQNNPGPDLETFLYSLKKTDANHGEVFEYNSPNSDLLGLLIERVARVAYADLLSDLIWQPMGAETNGYVTVDRMMLARGAGGICVTIDDLARFGQLILDRGAVSGKQIIPESWIDDTSTKGSQSAWQKGDFVGLLPKGCYRNQWYQVGDEDHSIMALGIHGQWLYINPTSEVVIAKMASQPEPADDRLDEQTLRVFSELCRSL